MSITNWMERWDAENRAQLAAQLQQHRAMVTVEMQSMMRKTDKQLETLSIALGSSYGESGSAAEAEKFEKMEHSPTELEEVEVDIIKRYNPLSYGRGCGLLRNATMKDESEE